MTTRERWDRLTDAVNDVLPVVLVSRSYPGGVSYHVGGRLPNGSDVEVHDKWWSKNDTVWVGYQVHVENAESIITRTWPITKNRASVVEQVRQAMSGVTPEGPRKPLGSMRKHEFVRRDNPDGGHRDRKCEACGLSDTNPVHDNAKGERL